MRKEMTDEEYWEALKNKWCMCGSKRRKYALYDARGIFLTYVCEECSAEKQKHYRPDVLTDPNYWHDEPIDEE